MTSVAALQSWICMLITYLQWYRGSRWAMAEKPAFRASEDAKFIREHKGFLQPYVSRVIMLCVDRQRSSYDPSVRHLRTCYVHSDADIQWLVSLPGACLCQAGVSFLYIRAVFSSKSEWVIGEYFCCRFNWNTWLTFTIMSAHTCDEPKQDVDPGGVSPVAKFITSYLPLVSALPCLPSLLLIDPLRSRFSCCYIAHTSSSTRPASRSWLTCPSGTE